MTLNSFCRAVEHTAVGQAMGHSSWGFPTVETIHHTAMIVLVASILAFDLRLMGVGLQGKSVSYLSWKLLPWTWTAFGVMVVTGTLLYTSDAVTKYCHNEAFYIKLILIAFSGLNVLLFQYTVYRRVEEWDLSPSPPLQAKLAGIASIVLWAGVVVAGRWIGFA